MEIVKPVETNDGEIKKEQIKIIEQSVHKSTIKYEEKPFKLHNLIIDVNDKFHLFVLGFEETNTKKIKKCSNNSDKIQLEKCEDFTDKEVLHFFYKHGNYVIVNKS